MSKADTNTVELSTTCRYVHKYCTECEYTTDLEYGEDDCPECGTDLSDEPEDYDYDCPCWESDTDDLRYFVRQWVERNPAKSGYYVIDGSGMGWRNLSGMKIISADELETEPWEGMGVNSDWTQTWKITPKRGGELTVSQSHHDAWGEHYEIRVLTMKGYDKLKRQGYVD